MTVRGNIAVVGSPADGTTVTGSNTNLTGVNIGASNTYTIESADSFGKRRLKAVQGAANQLTSYRDYGSPSALFGGVVPLSYTWGGTPVTTTMRRWYAGAAGTGNLGSLLITSTNRLQFVEGGTGTPLNVTSTGTAMTPGTDYMLVYLINTTANTFTASIYPSGSATALFTIGGNLGADMAAASGVQSYRHGINTSSATGLTLWTSEGQTSFDSAPVRYDVANSPPTVTLAASPAADAEPGQTVTLTATGTDTDGSIASYAFTQTGGTTVSLSGTGSVRTYVAPATLLGDIQAFQVVVTDDQSATGSTSLSIAVVPASIRLKTVAGIVPAVAFAKR